MQSRGGSVLTWKSWCVCVGLREGAGVDSEVVGEKWVMLWGDREGQGHVGAGQEQARSQEKAG